MVHAFSKTIITSRKTTRVLKIVIHPILLSTLINNYIAIVKRRCVDSLSLTLVDLWDTLD